MSDPAHPSLEILDPEPGSAAHDANRRPADIEEDIARTRAELGETLDALERKLAPRQLLEKGVDMLRDTMDGNLGRVGETLRANPIPLALVAGGLGWLLLTRAGGTRSVGQLGGDMARRTTDAVSGVAARIKDTIAVGKPSDPTSDDYAYARPKPGTSMGDRMAGRGQPTSEAEVSGVGEPADRVRTRFSQLLDEHPLALGALGFLAGAVFAMALPSTRLGDGTLGEAGGRLLDEAKQRGRDVVERVRHAAGAAADAAGGAVEKAEPTEAVKPPSEATAAKIDTTSGL